MFRSSSSIHRAVLVSFGLILVIGVAGLVYLGVASKNDASNTRVDAIRQITQSEIANNLKSYWMYENTKDRQLFLYYPQNNQSTPFIKLAEGERISVSPDGKKILRTKQNIVEVARATVDPQFIQMYADAHQGSVVEAIWLPDSSGMLLSSRQQNSFGDEPNFLYTVSRINIDGTGLKKLFSYPVALGELTLQGADMSRDEVYYSEAGEGGLRVALGIYSLSGGAQKDAYQSGDNSEPLPVADGKAYKPRTAIDSMTNKQRAQIIEVDLDSQKEKVVYNSALVEGRNFKRADGGDFSEGIAIRTLKLSPDGKTLYFDQIHNQEITDTKLKSLVLADGTVKDLYSPSMKGSYITTAVLAADAQGLIAHVSCGGCGSAEYEKLGNEYVYIELSTGSSSVIAKTTSGQRLLTIFPVLLQQ